MDSATDDSPLRRYRKARGLKLDELAAQVPITPGQLSRIERGGATSLPTAMRLAELTGLPIRDFAKAPVSAGEAA